MPQRWDAQGNPISDAAAAPTQRWDASGKPIAAPTAAPTDPFGFATTGTGGGPEAEMVRRHARSRAGKSELTETPSLFSRGTIDQALGATGELAKGTAGLVGGALGSIGSPGAAFKFGADLAAPQIQEAQKAETAPTAPERFGHGLAAALPGAGPMAAQAGESLGQVANDPTMAGRALVQTAAALGPSFMGLLRKSTNLARTGDAITNGMTRLSKEQIRPPLQVFEDRVNQEVAQHAQGVIAADEARAARGNRVLVNTATAHNAAQQTINSMKGYTPSDIVTDYVNGSLTRNTLADAKTFTTDLGRRLRPTGGVTPQDVRVLQTLYDKMHEATQAHADAMGAQYGRSWKQYIDVHAAHMERLKGLMGDLQEGFDGPGVVNKLIDTNKSAEFHQIVSEMKQYGIDTTPLESAREYGYSLQDTFQRTSNLFFGKLRAMIRYPLTAGTAAVGASEVAKLSGIPGMSFALPLIVAGKVAGILDLKQMRTLLQDIQKGQLKAGSPAPEAPVSPYERTMPPPIQPPGPPQQGPTPAAPPAGPPPGRAGQAAQVQSARGSRAQSGVYRGRRP